MNNVINVIVFLAGIIVQFSWTKYFAVYGLAPNILLVALVYISLMQGSLRGQLFGFAWGIAWDVLSVDLFGSHAFLFTLIGYLTGKLSHKWDETKGVTQMMLTGMASVLFSAGMFSLYQVFSPQEYAFSWNYITFLQPVLNMAVAPLLFFAASFLDLERR